MAMNMAKLLDEALRVAFLLSISRPRPVSWCLGSFEAVPPPDTRHQTPDTKPRPVSWCPGTCVAATPDPPRPQAGSVSRHRAAPPLGGAAPEKG